ncbi:hypothetical protein ALI22I_33915 [Saccharothrix sp. ALI-22-I]|uniref:VG15 protein n=1 Tax=Saccharothrix sp. ALI-22-I TaxID=1933778 RepID=UPI00097C7CC9|nr:hypothetical protein [Saccharothrix sp. ALI-22-I]ONI83492.1 hypothetical protein ALI22I_33915 [Saccharothrix sp. ALI-22-I]
MTAPVPASESDAASVAFHLALTQIGVATIQDALDLWSNVPPARTTALSAAWLARAVRLVMIRRRQSRDLAMAYYRLARALRTGTTIADPRRPAPPYVTLSMLRAEFTALTSPEAPQEDAEEPAGTTSRPIPERPAESGPEPESRPTDTPEEDRVPVETIDGLDRELERLEREAEAEARLVLEVLGLDNLDSKLNEIDEELPASEVDAMRAEAHRKAGAHQAAAAERVAMNGARSTTWATAERDRRVLGYVRLSRTGTPCGWCAMLISRGAVYRSEQSAIYADGDKYHDGCHCYCEVIYTREQFDQSSLTSLNRRYRAEWKTHIADKGFKGKAALTEWRRRIRREQREAARLARARPGDAA